MPTKPQLIAAFDVIAKRHGITNPDRVLTTRRWREEFLKELNIADEQTEDSALHQLLNLRKSKALKKPATLSLTRKAAS